MKKNTKKYVPKRHVNVFSDKGQAEVGSAVSQTKTFNDTWLGKNMGGVISAASGAVNLASGLVSDLKGNQDAINATEANIADANSTSFSGGTTADLMSQWSSTNLLDNVSRKQFRSDRGVLGVASDTLSGASAGASLGPWGAIGGAVAGLGKGLVGLFGSKNKAKRLERKYNAQIADANQRIIDNFNNAIANQQQEMIRNSMFNYAADGGPLEANGIIWPSELMYINKGGSHEENPYEGIQIGVDPEGVPNLVEEGEVVDKANNYVFSDRLKPSKELRDKYKLGKGGSYADGIKKVAKYSEERPNDKIAKDTFEIIKNDFIMDHEQTRAKKQSKTSNIFDKGSWMNYKYSSPMDLHSRYYDKGNYTDNYRKAFSYIQGLSDKDYNSFIEEYKKSNNADLGYWKSNPNRPLTRDDLSKGAFDHKNSTMHQLVQFAGNKLWDKEMLDLAWNNATKDISIEDIPFEPIPDLEPINTDVDLNITKRTIPKSKPKHNWINDFARTAPMLAAALEGMSLKKDTSNIDRFERSVSNMPKVEFVPLGDYVTPKYVDRNYLANKLAQYSNASVLNRTGNPSDRIAEIANRFNLIGNIGDAYITADKTNWDRYLGASEFNRGTNQYNSTQSMAAQQANANLYNSKLGHLYNIMNAREALDTQFTGAKSQAFNNLMTGLSDYGRERTMLGWVNNNPALLYKLLGNKLGYKGV